MEIFISLINAATSIINFITSIGNKNKNRDKDISANKTIKNNIATNNENCTVFQDIQGDIYITSEKEKQQQESENAFMPAILWLFVILIISWVLFTYPIIQLVLGLILSILCLLFQFEVNNNTINLSYKPKTNTLHFVITILNFVFGICCILKHVIFNLPTEGMDLLYECCITFLSNMLFGCSILINIHITSFYRRKMSNTHVVSFSVIELVILVVAITLALLPARIVGFGYFQS